MNGSKYLFDTNAVIACLKGSSFIDNLVNNADWLGISVISVLELYSFKDLTDSDKTIFSVFCNRVEVIDLSLHTNPTLIFQASSLRTLYNLKLPDAVIGSSALINNAAIITNDQQFNRIPNLQVIHF